MTPEPSALFDPRISYPSYKSFDDFIDVAALRALDAYLAERVMRHAAAQNDLQFYTGPFKLQNSLPDRPGSRMIYLKQSRLPDNYFDLDRTELWEPTAAAGEFSRLMDFVATLPFKATGRILIMYDDAGRPVTAHRDHTKTDTCHEFIWFRSNLNKPFYLLDHRTGERRFVESHSAWFDTVNQFHGSDAGTGLTFSIRVDGAFTDEFKKRIPTSTINPASTPSLWACTADK